MIKACVCLFLVRRKKMVQGFGEEGRTNNEIYNDDFSDMVAEHRSIRPMKVLKKRIKNPIAEASALGQQGIEQK